MTCAFRRAAVALAVFLSAAFLPFGVQGLERRTGPVCDSAAAGPPSLRWLNLFCDRQPITAITSAFYGRSDKTTCPYPGGTSAMQNTACSAANYLQAVRTACIGKYYCDVGGGALVGDPCVGTFKWANITYTCSCNYTQASVGAPGCPPDHVLQGNVCYPKCPGFAWTYRGQGHQGLENIGDKCMYTCPASWPAAQGALCPMPGPYSRGVGYPWKFGDGFNLDAAKARCEAAEGLDCQQSGLVYYPVCKYSFYESGLDCIPYCFGYYGPIVTLGGVQFCDRGKSSQTTSAGKGVPRECPAGQELFEGRCYLPCRHSGFSGTGPNCTVPGCQP